MYLSHFGLNRNPFALAPDPRFYMQTQSHRAALATLEYSVLRANDFCLLTGEVGSGKTTLIRTLVERMQHRSLVGVVYQLHTAFGDLMDWVFDAFDLELPSERSMRIRRFRRFLESEALREGPPVLVLDEAQNLSVEDLDAVRVLSNLNADGVQRLQIILSGQPELRSTLRSSDMRQLVQRISVDCHVDPLALDEVRAYVTHRLRLAGCSRSLFSDDALLALHAYSRGIPRVINSLCDLSLLFAYTGGCRSVGRSVVDDVVVEKCADGLYWIPDPPVQLLPVSASHS